MAEITPEHLELAALAAGHLPGGPDYGPQVLERTLADGTECYREWRPHLDDGDTARLADKLRMYVDFRGTAVQARVIDGAWHRVERDDGTEPDKMRAWREAVVRCAAAVGERMRGER